MLACEGKPGRKGTDEHEMREMVAGMASGGVRGVDDGECKRAGRGIVPIQGRASVAVTEPDD